MPGVQGKGGCHGVKSRFPPMADRSLGLFNPAAGMRFKPGAGAAGEPGKRRFRSHGPFGWRAYP